MDQGSVSLQLMWCQYCNSGEEDLPEFWSKFLVVAALQNWDAKERKMANIPLFL